MSTMSTSITYIPDASHRIRGIAKLIKKKGIDHPFVKEVIESAKTASSKITSPENIDEWSVTHNSEVRALFWDARNVYGMIGKKDGIQSLGDALESTFQTLDYTNFLTLETPAAKDITESIIRLLYTFQGKGSRDEALESDEFRSLPRMIQQLFKTFWFGNKHELVPEDHCELPRVNSEGLIVGGGKVSSHVDADGILQLMNNADSVAAAAAAPVVLAAPTSGSGIGLGSNATQSTQQASEVHLPEEKENSKRVSFDNMEVDSPINKRKPDSPLSYNQQRQPLRRMGHCADVECNKLEWLEPCRHCDAWVCDECTEINCCMACSWLDEPLVMKY